MKRDASTSKGYPEAVVDAVLALAAPRGRPCLIAISGLQGSGKSTLAAQLVTAAGRRGDFALALSIDDFYFSRSDRRRLARSVHPLLATRGVPGTHDVGLLMHALDALGRATTDRAARLPRFDKGRDTRIAPSRWRRVTRSPALVVLEGWCVGVPPQRAPELRRPINMLERDEDPDALWRTWVNDQLHERYVALWRRLDRLVLLQAPSYAVVTRWRDEQELALRRRRAPRALSPEALRRFLMHYERLSRHALRELPARSDLRVVLDARRRVRRIVCA